MKLLRTGLIFLTFINFGWSQESSDFYNRPFVIYEGCENEEDKERCYDIMLHEFLAKQLNNKNLKDSIFIKAKRDTITMHTSILYDEKGIIVKSYSSISSPIKGKSDAIKNILDSILTVKPVLDTYNNGVAFTARNLYGFLLDRPNNSIVPILGYTPDEVPFNVIERVPVYKGCKKTLNNEELKQCMNDKISKLISSNFNIKLASTLGLPEGIVRIHVMFKVDKKGRITGIKARAPHKALEQEAIRVIQKIPKLKKPGYQRNKPVIVPYAIPIVFRITD